MHNFAHSGVDHATNAESMAHILPAMIAVTIAIGLIMYVLARFLSNSSKKENESE